MPNHPTATRSAAQSARVARPLSPHLQVYAPQLTSLTSISFRLSGIVLAAGVFMLVWWVLAAASGPEAFAVVQGFLGSWLGLVMLFGWSLALFWHLANGIRHLFWDAGYGYELATAYRSGWAAVAVTVILTAVAWIAGLVILGGQP